MNLKYRPCFIRSLFFMVLCISALDAAAAPVGITERVSVASDGTEGNGFTWATAISADGRYVAFTSFADNLVPGDTNGAVDVFVRDRQTGATERVSVASDGTQGNGFFTFEVAISADGRYVAFDSDASNLVPGDTNGQTDVFVHDRDTGVTERVSVASDGTEGDGLAQSPAVSADGRYIAFVSAADNLVAGDTNGVNDVFLHDRDTGQTVRVSVTSDGSEGDFGSARAAISADGRYIAFQSEASNLVADDTNSHWDIFVHDRDTGATERVSVASDGTEGNQGATGPAISADGRYVVFQSFADNFVPGDTNSQQDVFVHDRDTGVTERVSVASDGTESNHNSLDAAFSPDGRYVAFASNADNLVADDTNSQSDIFIHNRESGVTERVSVASDGTEGNGGSNAPAISADGLHIAFSDDSDNLVPGDTNAQSDIFAHSPGFLASVPDPLDFGAAVVGQTNGPQSVTLTNARAPQLTITDISAPPVPFAAEGGTCGSLPITLDLGESCELQYSFSPGEGGVFSEVIAITSDAPTSPDGFTLQGEGVAAAPFVDTMRVSVASGGAEGNSHSSSPAISADGRYAVFMSAADNLVPGDTNGEFDVFVHDRETGTTERVSVATDGSEGNDRSDHAAISADGRYVAFRSSADNLVPGDANGQRDIFVHDRETGTTERVSAASDGSEANGFSAEPVISADGRYIAFYSAADNLVPDDTNGANDVFLHDRDTGQTVRVSVASDGSEGNSGSSRPAISADGRYIAFSGDANNLVPNDTNNQTDTFVHDRDSGVTERVSLASDGTEGNQGASNAAISADGRYVAFLSFADNFVPGDTNGSRDMFVHDRDTGTTARVTVASDGTEGNSNSGDPAISPDGRYAAFSSNADNLVADDTNGRTDIFIHDLETGLTERVSLATDGSEGNNSSSDPAISAGGLHIAFRSGADNLVPGDTNGSNDIFVHSVGFLTSVPNPLDFGAAVVGQTNGPLSVTLTNARSPQLTITDISIPPAPFAADGGTCGSLPITLNMGESCELAYSFSPASEEAFASAVILTTDAPDSPSGFALVGRGVPEALSITPGVLDFGGVLPGDTGGPATVTLTSGQDTAIEVSAVTTPGAPFAAAGGTCGSAPFTLAPFASCTLEYTFSPEWVDDFSEFVEVTSDAPSGPSGFTLQGEGLARALSVTPELLAFGNQPLGEVGGPLSVTLTSVGLLDVTLGDVSVPGAPFELVDNTCGGVLSAGASCSLTYSYTPTSQTSSLADVTITSDAQSNPHTVTLFGAGVIHGTELISRATGASGAKGDWDSGLGEISADGRFVAFQSEAALDPDDTNGDRRTDIYLRDTRTQTTHLVSRSGGVDGEVGDWGSRAPSVSADGRFVTFTSSATNLHPDDGDDTSDIYVRDMLTHENILISRAAGPDGVKGNDVSQISSISADGRFVAFISDASNLHPDVPAGGRHIYMRDLQTDELFLVSRASGVDGEVANGGAVWPSVSADGQRIAFSSIASNLHPDDGDDIDDIFVRDMQTHEILLVSRASGADGVKGNGWSDAPAISADGRLVAWVDQSDNLDPDDVGNLVVDLYLRDLVTYETILLSRASGADGVKGMGHSKSPAISANGRFVAFETGSNNLHPDDDDAGNFDDIYVRDLVTHETLLASRAVGAGGEVSNATTGLPSISADGRYVAFASLADNLHPDDPDGTADMFVRDLLGAAGPRLVIEPASVGFGTLAGAGQSATAVLTLTNTGNEVLEVTSIEPPAPPFTLLGGTCGGLPTLPAGESCTLELEFSPTGFGEYDDVVVLNSNASPGRHEVSLYGSSVTDAAITVDPEMLAVTLNPGGIADEILTIGNQAESESLTWALTETAAMAGMVLRPAGVVTVAESGSVSGQAGEPPATGDELAPTTAPGASGEPSQPRAMSDFTPRGLETMITHSASSDVIQGTAPACPGQSVGDIFLRTFTLTDFGIFNEFDVSEVTFGIEVLEAAQEITVNLYTLEGEFVYDNMRLLGTATQELQPQQLSLVSLPVAATVPAGATLVVEIVVPGGQRFWPGANSWGESAPSYIGLNSDLLCSAFDEREPVPMATIGFPGAHLVMAVTGQTAPLDCTLPDWLAASPQSGTVAPGSDEPMTVTFDAAGLAEGGYGAFLCLENNDPRRSFTVVPQSLTVEEGGGSGPGELAVSPDTLDFGGITVGEVVTGEVNVLNAAAVGADTLALSSIELLSGAPEFEITGGDCQAGGTMLAPGDSCTVQVRFAPAAEQFHTGAFRVQTSGGQSATVGLFGSGVGDSGPAGTIFSDKFEQ